MVCIGVRTNQFVCCCRTASRWYLRTSYSPIRLPPTGSGMLTFDDNGTLRWDAAQIYWLWMPRICSISKLASVSAPSCPARATGQPPSARPARRKIADAAVVVIACCKAGTKNSRKQIVGGCGVEGREMQGAEAHGCWLGSVRLLVKNVVCWCRYPTMLWRRRIRQLVCRLLGSEGPHRSSCTRSSTKASRSASLISSNPGHAPLPVSATL